MIGQKTDFAVTARLDLEGKLSVKVTAARTYGKKFPRQAIVDQTITDKKVTDAIESALKKAIVDVREELDEQAAMAASEALYVAGKKKEAV